MNRTEEIAVKLERLRELLKDKNLDGVLLTRRDNFAWAIGGADNHVSNAADGGVATLLITQDEQYACMDNIEQPRIMTEELDGLGFEPVVNQWYAGGKDKALSEKITGLKVGSDVPFAGAAYIAQDIMPLRWSLLPPEVERYRKLGKACAKFMSESCKVIRPGMSEWQVAADLSGRLIEHMIEPQVVLVAADKRIRRYRHPIPTSNLVDKCCMVVLCGMHKGLILSMTRLVHFGALDEELKQKHQAVAEIDAATIAATKTGATAGQVFSVLKKTYENTGFTDEWKLHHQGGATGYSGRDWKACSESDTMPILENQAFAWNPSITGTKSEDTIITSSEGIEILSPTPELPTIEVQTEIGPMKRSDILIL